VRRRPLSRRRAPTQTRTSAARRDDRTPPHAPLDAATTKSSDLCRGRDCTHITTLAAPSLPTESARVALALNAHAVARSLCVPSAGCGCCAASAMRGAASLDTASARVTTAPLSHAINTRVASCDCVQHAHQNTHVRHQLCALPVRRREQSRWRCTESCAVRSGARRCQQCA
jgi:hypothetical protein